MPRLKKIDIDPATADVDGIADALPITTADPNGIAAALPTGTVWTVAGDAEYITVTVNSGKSQHIIVTTAADETTPQSTMTIVGTDRDGSAITEALTLPNTSTVVSTKQFLTVDEISVDVATTGVTDVGWLITSWNSAETALWVGTSAGDSLAHRLGIITVGNEPAGNSPLLTLIGTDADDRVQTETVTLPNATLVETTKYFKTVTEGSTGANALAGVFDIGWVDEVVSRIIPLNRHSGYAALCQVDVSGTIDFSIEITAENIQQTFTDQESVPWVPPQDTDLTTTTADTVGNLDAGATAMRVKINSFSAGAEVQVYISQASE